VGLAASGIAVKGEVVRLASEVQVKQLLSGISVGRLHVGEVSFVRALDHGEAGATHEPSVFDSFPVVRLGDE
jgi:hypothetical protein